MSNLVRMAATASWAVEVLESEMLTNGMGPSSRGIFEGILISTLSVAGGILTEALQEATASVRRVTHTPFCMASGATMTTLRRCGAPTRIILSASCVRPP